MTLKTKMIPINRVFYQYSRKPILEYEYESYVSSRLSPIVSPVGKGRRWAARHQRVVLGRRSGTEL